MFLIIVNSVHWAYWSCLWCFNNTFSKDLFLNNNTLRQTSWPSPTPHFLVTVLQLLWLLAGPQTCLFTVLSAFVLSVLSNARKSFLIAIAAQVSAIRNAPPGQPFTEEHYPSAPDPTLHFPEVTIFTISFFVLSGVRGQKQSKHIKEGVL